MKKRMLIIVVLCLTALLSCCNAATKENNETKAYKTTNKTTTLKTTTTNNLGIKPLSNIVYPSGEYVGDTVNSEYVESLNLFTEQTVKGLFKDLVDNQNYAPMSLYMALAMLTEGANNNTLSELLALLEVESKDALGDMMNSVYRKNYFEINVYEDKNKLYLKNSLWINNNETNKVQIKQQYIDRLSTKYFAEIFSENLALEDTKAGICDWVNKNTENFLDVKPEDILIDQATVLALFNTIYYKGTWDRSYFKQGELLFHGTKGDILTDFIGNRGHYTTAKTSKYTMISTKLSNGLIRYSMFLPNENSSIEELIKTDQTLLEILAMTSKNPTDDPNDEVKGEEIILKFPCFDIKSEYNDIINVLKELGCEEALGFYADYSPITDDANLFVSKIAQKTRFALDELGIEAAAFTQIISDATSVPEPVEELIIDRPFIYILSSDEGMPLFIGIVNYFE